jgi:DNA-directed RNA polymerase subunit L
MNIKVLALEKDRAKILVQGAGHTLMNAITDELLKDSDVDVAKYMIEFQFSDPELIVTTNGKKDPLVAIKEACIRISNNCNILLKEISKS